MKKSELEKVFKRLIKEAQEGEEVERMLAKLPPELKPFHGLIAGVLAFNGPKDIRNGAKKVMTERMFSEVNAHMRRNELKVITRKDWSKHKKAEGDYYTFNDPKCDCGLNGQVFYRKGPVPCHKLGCPAVKP